MLPLSPALFLAAASALVTGNEDHNRPDARQMGRTDRSAGRDSDIVALFGRDFGNPAASAALIGHIGYRSQREPEGASVWPFPIDADCDELALFADRRGVLNSRTPQPGAIYLQWSRRHCRFERAAIVLNVIGLAPMRETPWGYDCLMVEGGASLWPAEGQPERFVTAVQWARENVVWCSCRDGDRFISWVDLDSRDPSVLSFPPRQSQLPVEWKYRLRRARQVRK